MLPFESITSMILVETIILHARAGMARLAVMALALIVPVSLVAQQRNPYRKKTFEEKLIRLVTENWSVQLDIGPGLYYGDLSVNDKDPFTKIFNESSLSGQIVVANKINSWLALQGRVIYGGFKAENDQVNRLVDGSSILLGGNIMIDFVNLFSLPNEVFPDIYIYGIVGGGLVNIRSKLKNLTTGEEILTNPWNREAVNESAVYAGIGFNKYLGPNWDLVFELTMYHIRSDRFDGLQAGESDDYYVLPAVGIKYNLSRGLLAPKKQHFHYRKQPIRR